MKLMMLLLLQLMISGSGFDPLLISFLLFQLSRVNIQSLSFSLLRVRKSIYAGSKKLHSDVTLLEIINFS